MVITIAKFDVFPFDFEVKMYPAVFAVIFATNFTF